MPKNQQVSIAERNQKLWSEIDDPGFIESYITTANERRRWLAKVILLYKPRSVLELGCNAGNNLWHIKQLDPTINVAGIDIHPGAIEHAKKAVPDGHFVCGSLYDADKLMNGPFDVVFTCGVLIHIPPDKLSRAIDVARSLARTATLHLEEHSVMAKEMRWHEGEPWRWAHNYLHQYKNATIVHPIVETDTDGGHDLILPIVPKGLYAFWLLHVYPQIWTFKWRLKQRWQHRGWRSLIPNRPHGL